MHYLSIMNPVDILNLIGGIIAGGSILVLIFYVGYNIVEAIQHNIQDRKERKRIDKYNYYNKCGEIARQARMNGWDVHFINRNDGAYFVETEHKIDVSVVEIYSKTLSPDRHREEQDRRYREAIRIAMYDYASLYPSVVLNLGIIPKEDFIEKPKRFDI